ncbi:zinc finger protein [Cinnamomum micranthum f. kanehirae]|uniref:Zinc finger protein n=1 Tax=Cinnamomum micranthum f. kanehirae TaxID=337451 RepID=A0A443NZB0_9MAGN|nr:zinc finger protein [Cinnamomum micranthum f. kanehirae]
MEQETRNSFASPNDPIFCANNCGFFGSASNYNLCSKCYKDFLREKSHAIATTTIVEKKEKVEEEKQEEAIKQQPANRCNSCRKRVGLTGFKCRCGQTFCSIHRFAEEHGCSFDYKKRGKDEIARDNPLVRKDKIQRF